MEVFSVGEQDEHPVVVSIFIEKALGLVDRACEVGALAGYEIGVERVEGFTKCIVVESERAQGEGAAGERDQTDTVAVETRDEIENAKPRAFESVGC